MAQSKCVIASFKYIDDERMDWITVACDGPVPGTEDFVKNFAITPNLVYGFSGDVATGAGHVNAMRERGITTVEAALAYLRTNKRTIKSLIAGFDRVMCFLVVHFDVCFGLLWEIVAKMYFDHL
ncbi:OLC1v1006417C1 [Oldenlandia corymbosa var. corymbosa]|uniref:OLC1v1006417C1 n=1 Tax=Oldenlandia corymbosa var. corymbosa TaxID=529605 RepID=A0AAV1DKA5_OLDCO|nr:OLC1v1006417C1 [Oldenlandia corymbosa var. corymbosa]